MQKMLSLVRRCVEDYDMIAEGERVAVGVSGGKDSISLLAVLNALSHFYPKQFTLLAITLDLGFEGADFTQLSDYCKSLGVPHIVRKTDIKQVVFDIRQESNPCSLCAKLRRGALHDTALENGCKTVALGHHYDDAAETFLLSLFFEGRISCFAPKTFLDRREVTLIRPMLYIPEHRVRAFARKQALPVADSLCPADGGTKRQEVKVLIGTLERQYPDIKERISGAMQRYPLAGWKKEEIPVRRKTKM